MKVVIAGAGPAGLLTGACLARRGHQVVAIDRDPGPDERGGWQRRGVMQFEHAHAFRPQVAELLAREWPEALVAWEHAGAEPVMREIPGGGAVPMGHRSRRSTYERTLRAAAAEMPGLTVRSGHVDGLVRSAGRARGVTVDGVPVEGDLVVDATGRSGRPLTHLGQPAGETPPPALSSDCGIAYVDRVYRLRPGAEPGPLTSPIGLIAAHDGYQVLVFLHERRYFSVLFVRHRDDRDLTLLRRPEAFDAACAAVPELAAWTNASRSEPASDVRVGGALRNTYRDQADLVGLVAVGDSVATTAPTAGRGVALCASMVGRLVELIDELEAGGDPREVAAPFEAWCSEQIRPWVADHIACDDELARRWAGEALNVDDPLTSTRIIEAADHDPRIMQHAMPYLTMRGLPSSLEAAEPLAREAYRSGWRAAYAAGPARDSLAEIVLAAAGQG